MRIRLRDWIEERNERTTVSDQHPVLTCSQDGILLQSAYFKKQIASQDNTGYKIVHRGDFTYRAMSDTGRFYIHQMDCAEIGIVSPAYPVFYLKAGAPIVPEYLLLFFESELFHELVSSKSKGSTRLSLRLSKIGDITVEFPEVDEQNKRVALMNSLSQQIEDLNLREKSYGDTVKSLFIEMFGDPTKAGEEKLISIGDIGKLTSGGTPSRGKPQYFQGTIPWFTAGELNTKFLSDSIEHISEEALDNSSAKLFDPGSLMIGMYDTAAFKMGILTQKSSSNQACANLVPSEDYNVEWLYHCFELMKEKYLEERHGARQNNLSLTIIKKLMFPRAEKAKQDQFVAIVSKIDKLRFNAIKQKELFTEYRSSFLQDFFEGGNKHERI